MNFDDEIRLGQSSSGLVVECKGEFRLWNDKDATLLSFLSLSRQQLHETLSNENLSQRIENCPTLVNSLDPRFTPLMGAGVTFSNSLRERRLETFRLGSLEEVTDDGRPTPYDVVYDPVNPPEVFFKATRPGHLATPDELWIRPDGVPQPDGTQTMGSSVPEPERVLLVNRSGDVIAQTIGSDTTARQLESLSPLYLPAAKTYPGCTTLCPWWTVLPHDGLHDEILIQMIIERNGEVMYQDQYSSTQMKRTPESLVRHTRTLSENPDGSFDHGFGLFTGTGIIPGVEFSLMAGDQVTIESPQLGRSHSTVKVVQYSF